MKKMSRRTWWCGKCHENSETMDKKLSCFEEDIQDLILRKENKLQKNEVKHLSCVS